MNFFPVSYTEDASLRRQAGRDAAIKYGRAESSSTSDPIKLTSGSNPSGGTGEVVEIKSKSISADDVKKALTGDIDAELEFTEANVEFENLCKISSDLHDKLAKTRNEYDAKHKEIINKVRENKQNGTTDEQEIDKLKGELSTLLKAKNELEEKVKIADKTKEAYKTLTQKGVYQITGETAAKHKKEITTAYTTLDNFFKNDKFPSIEHGKLMNVAKTAMEYKTKQIDKLAGESTTEYLAAEEKAQRNDGKKSSTGTTLSASEKTNIENLRKLAEQGNEQAAKLLNDKKQQIKAQIDEQVKIVKLINHPEKIVKENPKNDEISQDDFVELLTKYKDSGFSIGNGKKKIEVTKEQIQKAIASVKGENTQDKLKARSLNAISGIYNHVDDYPNSVPGEADKEDRAIYMNLKKLSDEEFLALCAFGNEDKSRNHNINAGTIGAWKETLVESLFHGFMSGNNRHLSAMYIVARLTDIAKRKGVEDKDLNPLALRAYGEYKKGNTQALSILHNELNTTTINGQNDTLYEEAGLGYLMYGYGMGEGKGVQRRSLVAQALTGKTETSDEKLDVEKINFGMPSIRTAKNETISTELNAKKFYPEEVSRFGSHVQKKNEGSSNKDTVKATTIQVVNYEKLNKYYKQITGNGQITNIDEYVDKIEELNDKEKALLKSKIKVQRHITQEETKRKENLRKLAKELRSIREQGKRVEESKFSSLPNKNLLEYPNMVQEAQRLIDKADKTKPNWQEILISEVKASDYHQTVKTNICNEIRKYVKPQ